MNSTGATPNFRTENEHGLPDRKGEYKNHGDCKCSFFLVNIVHQDNTETIIREMQQRGRTASCEEMWIPRRLLTCKEMTINIINQLILTALSSISIGEVPL